MKKQQNIIHNMIPVFVILAVLLIWELISVTGLVPKYMLPTPLQVGKAFVTDFPLLMSHAKVTLTETVIGLMSGIVLGFVAAALMDAFVPVRKGLYPLLVISQTVPTVAIAPLLILWFSYGMAPKIVLVILASFFPIAVGLLDGFQSVDEDMIRLMRAMKANRWQIFWHVKFPYALGEFFSGLKIAVSYSVVGAVVSEWLGGFYGLGVYMTRVKKSYDYDKMFAVIFLVSAISLLMILTVKIIQYQSMPWQHCKDEIQIERKRG